MNYLIIVMSIYFTYKVGNIFIMLIDSIAKTVKRFNKYRDENGKINWEKSYNDLYGNKKIKVKTKAKIGFITNEES